MNIVYVREIQVLQHRPSDQINDLITNEVVNQQTLRVSEPVTGKARECRHSQTISSERNAASDRLRSSRGACLSASVDCVVGA